MTSTPEDRKRRAEEASAKAELQREAASRRIAEENERLRSIAVKTARLRELRLARDAEPQPAPVRADTGRTVRAASGRATRAGAANRAGHA